MLRAASLPRGNVMGGRRPAEERFWAKVEKTATCWLWTGFVNPKGYGQFGVAYRLVLAHRYSWSLANGPVSDGKLVCHKCDTPGCVRPDHLFLGSAKDNTTDMWQKGRGYVPETRRGAANNKAKISEETALAIRKRLCLGEKGSDIAKSLGVSKSIVSKIKTGRTWKTPRGD